MSAVSLGSDALRAPTLQAVMRALAGALPESRGVEPGAPLEMSAQSAEPPRLRSAQVIEGHDFHARRVDGEPEVPDWRPSPMQARAVTPFFSK